MKIEKLIYKMLQQNTGVHMCDSGGANGRMWQRNATKTLKDFKNEPEAMLDISNDYLDISMSVFHHLCKTLEIDKFCERFNKLPCADWDGDYYGTSVQQCEWLEGHEFEESRRGSFNTYNYDSNLSQVLQGTFLTSNGIDEYVLLQIHNGADVRGGYTDAKLFKTSDYFLFEDISFDVSESEGLDINGADVSLYNRDTYDSEYLGNAEINAWMDKQTIKSFNGYIIGG